MANSINRLLYRLMKKIVFTATIKYQFLFLAHVQYQPSRRIMPLLTILSYLKESNAIQFLI